MIKAYQGYFREDGRFIANNVTVKIPANRRVIINVLDDEIVEDNKADERKGIEKRRKALKAITGIIPEDFKFEIDEIRQERRMKKGLCE